MRILVLEDNENRIRKFRRELIGHRADYAKDVPAAAQFVAKHEYGLIFLDHDLGGKEMVKSGKGTGYELSEIIARDPKNRNVPVVVHTCNSVGADNIMRVLPHAYKAPFMVLDIRAAVEVLGQEPADG